MKRNKLLIFLLLSFLVLSAISDACGQVSRLQGFSFKVSPGALSYFGDMSTNNLNLPKRIATGSKFGISAGIARQFSPFFGVQAQFLTGSLYTFDDNNAYFAGSLSEFSLSCRFDPLKLITRNSTHFSPFLSIGVGTFGFRSVRREKETNVVLLPNFGYHQDGLTKTDKPTAMSLPVAIGVSYKIQPNLQVELEHALRITNTDLLDCFKGPGTSNDLYSLTSIGLRYTIRSKSGKNIDTAGKLTGTPEIRSDKPAEKIKAETIQKDFSVDFYIPESLQAGQTVDVKVLIKKGDYLGPGKLIQKFPFGFTALAGQLKNYSFLFIDQNVIIDWERMPADSIVSYSYLVKVGDKVSGSQTIIGRFEYQRPEGAKTIRFNKSVFIDNQSTIVDKEIPANQLARQDDSIVPVNQVIADKKNILPSQSLSGIEFRIQCGAFRDNSQAETQLAAKYKITEIIQEEYTDGWYRYTVGSFRDYEEAVRYRKNFIERTGIATAFVVAYKDGRRLASISDAFK